MTVPTSMRAWRVHEYGRPGDALQLDEVPVPEPGPGQVRVRVQAIPLPDAAAPCRELGADAAIDYEEGDFSEVVLDETGGRGVDVVFDNVGEAVLQKAMRCIAFDGRYLIMGFASDKSVVDEKLIVPRSVSAGNFSVCGVMLAYLDAAFEELPAAIEALASRQTVGRTPVRLW